MRVTKAAGRIKIGAPGRARPKKTRDVLDRAEKRDLSLIALRFAHLHHKEHRHGLIQSTLLFHWMT